jgi:hypothetical protein
MMKTKVALLSIIALLSAGCAYTVFAPPSVLYSNEDSIGIRYRSAGIQSVNEAEKAMQLVSSHCGESFVVTNRSESNGWTTIDARCE